jgi:hypothetical protein
VLIREDLSLRCPSFAASGDGAGFLLQAVGRVSGHRAVAPGISVWGLRLGGGGGVKVGCPVRGEGWPGREP